MRTVASSRVTWYPMTQLSDEAAAYLLGFHRKYPGLLDTPEGRRVLTRLNPRLFALTYLRAHLAGDETHDTISFSEAHLDWYDQVLQWVKPATEPKGWRRGYVAPRASGKSTFWYLIAPMWAAAHGHAKFVAAFSDSASQAEGHLATFKRELDTNDLIRRDYPKLTMPLMRGSRGVSVADSRSLMVQRNQFVFAAKGVDSATLGMKVGERRPDLIILDDVEPVGSNYSAYLSEKRLATIANGIMPLNEWARLVWVGTVTTEGSLVHQLVKSVTSGEEPSKWIGEEKIQVAYHPALITNDDGTERSLWPEKWPLEYLQGMRNSRAFALNYQNLPVAGDGLYWSDADIVVEEIPGGTPTRTILSIDPAVTTKNTSDFTGLAVLSHSPQVRDRFGNVTGTGKVYVRHVEAVKMGSKELRLRVVQILERFPEVRVILNEINQGGDLWASVFADLPVKYVTKQQSIKKEVRAGWLLEGYQRRQVVHTCDLPAYRAQLLAFPTGLNDDMIDSCSTGYAWLTGIGQERRTKMASRTV